MNRRVVGLIAALLLAVVGTFTIVVFVHGANARALDGQKTIDVLIVQKKIAAGTPADQLGGSVKTEAIIKKVEADGAVTDLKQLKGRVSSATLVPGEQLVQARFVDASTFRAAAVGVSVPSGLLETTIALDPERALGGLITPGSHVAVTASFDDHNGDPAQTHMILHNVLVTNVQMTQAADSKTFASSGSGNTASSASDAKPGTAPGGRLFVTLALSAPASEQIVFATERGSLWLSNEPSGAPTTGTRIVSRSNALQ